MRLRRTFTAALAAAAATIGACGSTGSSSGSTPGGTSSGVGGSGRVTACSLVDAAAASQAMGEKLEASTAAAATDTLCTYSAANLDTVSILIKDSRAGLAARAALDVIAHENSNANPVDGIGDKAILYQSDGGRTGVVVFVKGSLVVTVTVNRRSGDADPTDPAQQLARTAAAKLAG